MNFNGGCTALGRSSGDYGGVADGNDLSYVSSGDSKLLARLRSGRVSDNIAPNSSGQSQKPVHTVDKNKRKTSCVDSFRGNSDVQQ